MRLVVVDASASLAWAIADEQAGPGPAHLLDMYYAAEVQLSAPSVWEYEVANALKVALIRGRATQAEALDGLGFLRGLGIQLAAFQPLADLSWDLAVERRLSMYDASYLALAQLRGCELCTGDKRLAEVAQEVGVGVWAG
jgi:predicted nucleic acid-binding protein